jgi:hypothetical protein
VTKHTEVAGYRAHLLKEMHMRHSVSTLSSWLFSYITSTLRSSFPSHREPGCFPARAWRGEWSRVPGAGTEGLGGSLRKEAPLQEFRGIISQAPMVAGLESQRRS